jgi:simple sugar transport system substrate-binding protein
MTRIHPKVEEALDTVPLSPLSRRRLLRGAGLASASMAATALLAACTDDAAPAGAVGNFPATPRWKFVLVCHVTTNPFFTPTQYGAEDACKLLGVDYQWT